VKFGIYYVDDVKVGAANARIRDFDQNLVAPGDGWLGDLSESQLLGAVVELEGGVWRTHNYSFPVAQLVVEERAKVCLS